MATLAANRMSRKLPQRRLFKLSDSPGFVFRPDSGHECLSVELYGSALRKMSCWSPEKFDLNPLLTFAVLVLFCYVESSMGYFKGFYIHSQGVEKLLKKSADLIFPQGTGLLAAWVEVKMQNWWRRAYFGVPEFFQDYFNPLLSPQVQFISKTKSGRTATILWILCESHRLNTAALIACWAGHENSSQMMGENTISKFIDNDTTASERPFRFSEFAVMIKIYSEKLDEWRVSLPGLAEVEENTNRPKRLGSKKPENEAIYFPSHKLAMNMAYYVVARVIHCAGPLQTFASASIHNIDDIYEETEAWILILLRIAAGISWEDCICLNVYTIGFAGLLFACALSSRSLESGLWIQEWLEKRLEQGGIEEGNFPIFQILDAVRLINRERRNGLDVVALFQTVDDGGGRVGLIAPK
ncbi:fungal transcriptional regulatory [Trichoderma arundinaceum]|uniref:Fungal transcriptional regulatory n=1 Tax=Trichoderma arundinaceum TaxID=490622 RepID=A0A395NJD6_TRIAR|nr:fungal transcriptional regulatory [Trichoderma arundinaceum]